MRTIGFWAVFMLACSKSPLAAGIRCIDPISTAGSGRIGYIAEKRVELTEPTCEELKAMWRHTKRQSRAIKSTTGGYPLYSDRFSYNMLQTYSESAAKPSPSYQDKFVARARSRAAGGAPIYGRMVHKAPAGSRLRNGMRHSSRPFEDVTRFYGRINRYPPSTRRRLSSFRVGGGAPSPLPQVPQAGSFLHLKELMRAQRTRQLQEEHMAEEAAAFDACTNDEHRSWMQQPRKQFLDPLPALQIPSKLNYEFGQGRYLSNVPNIGQTWSRSGPQSREYMFR